MKKNEVKTVVLQIGNSDNKLSQQRWAEFCTMIYKTISFWNNEMFFSAPSVRWADWQNCCYVFSINNKSALILKIELERIRKLYEQDSVAWTEGTTEFV